MLFDTDDLFDEAPQYGHVLLSYDSELRDASLHINEQAISPIPSQLSNSSVGTCNPHRT